MQSAQVTVGHVSPLLMHAFPLGEPPKPPEKMSPEEEADWGAYRNADKKFVVPAHCVQGSFVRGGSFSKGKGRASLSALVGSTVSVTPADLIIDNQKPAIDTRIVKNPVTKGRHPRSRYRFDEWSITFTVTWDERWLTEKQVRQVVDDAFCLVGILDYRPIPSKGPFGRGVVNKWETNGS